MENSMDIILGKIIETDKASREKVNESKKRLSELDTEIAEAKKAIDGELQAASSKSIAKNTETAEIKFKKEIERIDLFYAEAEQKLRDAFTENRDALTEKIFKKITE